MAELLTFSNQTGFIPSETDQEVQLVTLDLFAEGLQLPRDKIFNE